VASQQVSLLLLTDQGLRVLSADILGNFFPFGEFAISSGPAPGQVLPVVQISSLLLI